MVEKDNSIHEHFESRFNSANACRHQVQNLLSSSFLGKNVKIQKLILPVIADGCETWPLTLGAEHS